MAERWWGREGAWLAVLVVVALLFRYPFIFGHPLQLDETLYAEIIDEFTKKPGPVPVFYGMPVTWKPILAFAAYSPLVVFFRGLGVNNEELYRLPPVVFGVLNTLVVYFLLNRMDFEEKPKKEIAFVGALAYAAMPLAAETETMLLTDSFFVFLINLALLCYTNAKKPEWLAAATVLSFLAAWTKTFAALIIPLLALAYWFWRERGFAKNPFFIASLAGVPAGLASYAALVWGIPGVQDEFIFDVTGRFFLYGIAKTTLMGASHFVSLTLPWNVFAALGVWKFWRKNIFCAFWLALSAPITLAAYTLFWYFLPIAPAIAWFSARYLVHPRIDLLTVLTAALLAGAAFAGMYAQQLFYDKNFEEQKEIGLYLRDKDNVLYFGPQASTLVYYFLSGNESKHYTVVYTWSWLLNDEMAENVTGGREYFVVSMNEGFFKSGLVGWGTWKGEYDYIASQPEIWANYSKAFAGYVVVRNSSLGSYQVFRRVQA